MAFPSNLGAGPSESCATVTPSDTVPLTNIPRALYVGVGGDITMQGVGGTSDKLWKNVPSGYILPFRAQYIRATGTTATNILALD